MLRCAMAAKVAEAAELAVDMMLDIIQSQGAPAPAMRTTSTPRLVMRDSTARAVPRRS